MLTYLQAVVLGVLQGVTELFPVSSLGHSVILPQLLGWTDVVAAQSAPESYFLAFLVAAAFFRAAGLAGAGFPSAAAEAFAAGAASLGAASLGPLPPFSDSIPFLRSWLG